jgi:hypothetical protein
VSSGHDPVSKFGHPAVEVALLDRPEPADASGEQHKRPLVVGRTKPDFHRDGQDVRPMPDLIVISSGSADWSFQSRPAIASRQHLFASVRARSISKSSV